MNSRVSLIEGEYLDGNSVDPDLDAAFSAFRDSLTDGEDAEGTMSAYKVPMDKDGNTIAKSAKQAFLFSCPLGSVTLIDIINRCKRDFMRRGELVMTVRLTGHRPKQRGNEFNKIIRIEKENEPEERQSVPGQPDIVELMRATQDAMTQQAQRSEAFMQRIMELQIAARVQPVAPAASSDPFDMIQKFAMLQAVMNKMMPMLAAPAATATALDPVQQLMGTMRLMKEFKNVMGDGGGESDGDGDNWMSTIKGLGGPFLSLLAENEKTKRVLIARQKQLPGKPRPAAPNPAGVASATASATPAASTSEPQGDSSMIAQMREQLKSLCAMAADGTSAEDAAQLVLDMIPEEGDFDSQLGDLVADENKERFMPTIATLYAGCKQHAAWFEELRVNLALGYADPDEAHEPDA